MLWSIFYTNLIVFDHILLREIWVVIVGTREKGNRMENRLRTSSLVYHIH